MWHAPSVNLCAKRRGMMLLSVSKYVSDTIYPTWYARSHYIVLASHVRHIHGYMGQACYWMILKHNSCGLWWTMWLAFSQPPLSKWNWKSIDIWFALEKTLTLSCWIPLILKLLSTFPNIGKPPQIQGSSIGERCWISTSMAWSAQGHAETPQRVAWFLNVKGDRPLKGGFLHSHHHITEVLYILDRIGPATWLYIESTIKNCKHLHSKHFKTFRNILFLRKDYGSPISRRRVYILILKKSLMVDRDLESFISDMKAALQEPAAVRWHLDYILWVYECWELNSIKHFGSSSNSMFT